MLILLTSCKTMTVKIEDIRKVDFDNVKTEKDLIERSLEKINILTEYIKNLRIQIIAADGYQIKVIDLREGDKKNGN